MDYQKSTKDGVDDSFFLQQVTVLMMTSCIMQ